MSIAPADLKVECPLCDGRFAEFAPVGRRAGAICPGCNSRERHRALWLVLRERPELLAQARSLLHFAPESFLEEHLGRLSGFKYVTADLDPRRAQLPLDVTDIALPDETFHAILCSHVLEHVPDDRGAMRELYRILRHGGWLIVMVPLDIWREETYEDPSVTEPEDRLREFRQADHVRLYAPDIVDRLRDAGFEVETIALVERLGEELARRHGLLRSDYVFLCHKREAPPAAESE